MRKVFYNFIKLKNFLCEIKIMMIFSFMFIKIMLKWPMYYSISLRRLLNSRKAIFRYFDFFHMFLTNYFLRLLIIIISIRILLVFWMIKFVICSNYFVIKSVCCLFHLRNKVCLPISVYYDWPTSCVFTVNLLKKLLGRNVNRIH